MLESMNFQHITKMEAGNFVFEDRKKKSGVEGLTKVESVVSLRMRLRGSVCVCVDHKKKVKGFFKCAYLLLPYKLGIVIF